MIWRFGMVDAVVKIYNISSKTAKAIIGTAVYGVSAAIGTAFTYLCKIVRDLIKKIFG
jgi:hypothetical protein